MRKRMCVGIVAVVLFGIVARFTIQAQSEGPRKTPPEKYTTRVFDDAGLQMELPDKAPSESGSKKSVLVMLHPTSQGEQAEQGYCVKIHVRRLSKAELDSNGRMAVHPSTDDFNKWYTTNHPSLDTRKVSNVWRVRKDVPTPEGLSLFIDGQVTVTKSVDADLAETKRIVESIKPLR